MKKFFVALAVVAMTTAFTANAANDEKACTKKDAKCERVDCKEQKQKQCPLAEFKDLNLTDAQKEQLTALKAEQKAARTEAKKDKKAAKAEMRREGRQQYLAKVKSILTPEQYTKYMENQLVDGHKGKPVMRHHGGKRQMEGEKAMRMKGKALETQKAEKVQKADKVAK